MSDYKSVSGMEVIVGNDAKLKSKGKANVQITGDSNIAEIKDVLHVPGLGVNLLSVSQMADQSIIAVFDDERCTLYDKENLKVEGTIIGTATRVEGLYIQAGY